MSDRDGNDRDDSVVGALLVPVLLVAAAALVGWLLLALAKAVVVDITYAVGIALVVVTLLMSPRLVRGRTGTARWRRIGSITTAVLLGAVLIVVAHEVHRHGWLLIAIPAAIITVSRLVDRVAARRSQ
jgi:hypothetical protein